MSKEIFLTRGHVTIVDDEDYDYLSQFKWRAAVFQNNRVYATRSVRIEGMRFQCAEQIHRVVMNAKKGETVDHINLNTLDNRKENLRKCTIAQNSKNQRGFPDKRKSKYKGVRKKWNRYYARITSDGICHDLGSFETELEAAKAYDEASRKLHGEFGRTNKDEGNYD